MKLFYEFFRSGRMGAEKIFQDQEIGHGVKQQVDDGGQ